MKVTKIWVFIVIFVLFSFAPTFYELGRASDLQANRQFELVHNFPTDYNFYLSRIRQGLDGKLAVQELYTTEPHRSSFIHEMYLLMGKAGGVVGVPNNQPGYVYHVARFVLAVVLLYATYELCRRAGYATMLAFLLAVTASSWPKFVLVDGFPRFGGFMPWWSVMDSLQRISFLPHLLLGQVLMVFIALVMWGNSIHTAKIVAFGIGGFVLGMVFPPGLIFLYTLGGVYIAVTYLWGNPKAAVMKNFLTRLIGFGLISVPSVIYLFFMTSFYPWKRLAEFDVLHPLPFDYLEYFTAVGPMLPLGIAGLVLALYKRRQTLFIAVSWVIAWLFLLVAFRFVPSQSPLRFSEMIPHIALGALTAYLFWELSRVPMLKKLAPIIASVLVVLGLAQMASSYMWQKDFVDHKIRATVPLVPTGSYVMYPLKDFMNAIAYIQNNTKREEIILSQTTAGNYIPAYSGNRVYVGHDNTVHAEEKKARVALFFAGKMKADEARAFIKETGARMIFFGPQEREAGPLSELGAVYPFLKPVYRNAHVILYAIQ